MNDPDLSKRVERLEDAQAFGDRTAEQLSEQLVDVFARIEALDRRLRGLESRLAAMGEQPPADDSGDESATGS